MRATLALAGVLVLSAALAADERIVLVDESVSFSRFATFTLSDTGIDSTRPELNVPIFKQSIADAVTQSLVAGGLKETGSAADLLVVFNVKAVDFTVGPFGRVAAVDPGGGRRGPPRDPVDFSEATLVIDAYRSNPRELVWRGIYRIADNDAQKLVDSLSKNAIRLASELSQQRRKK